MKRTALLAIVSSLLLGGCATSSTAGEVRSYTVVPQVQVVEKVAKKKNAQANYQVAPGEAPLTGSGGSAR
jgi:hypothetical protein